MSAPRFSIRPWVIGLGLIAAGLAAYLLLADNPWDAARETAERLEAGKRARPEADFVTALWVVAAANLVIVLALLASVKLWLPRLSLGPIEKDAAGFSLPKKDRRWIPALLVILVIGSFARLPLASGSLWWDELWGIKFGIVGYYIGEEDEPVEDRFFAEADWRRALWYYTRPTNHPAASFPARLSHLVWRTFADPEKPHAFSDFAVRFPNFLASLGTLAAIVLLGRACGRLGLGFSAALILALHPWAIRYGVDLRGYSWVMLWTATGLLWLTALFREGKQPRWWLWLGFGINQALLVWAFPHAALVAAGLVGAALVFIMRGWKSWGDRFAAMGRLLFVNVMAGMLFLQLFGPNLLQMKSWLKDVNANHTEHSLDGRLLRDLAIDVVSGQPWQVSEEDLAEGFADFFGLGNWKWLALSVVIAGLIFGAVRLWRNLRPAAIAVGAVVGAGVALLLVFRITEAFFYPRFAIFLVIPFVLLLGAAADPGVGKLRYRALFPGVLIVVAFLLLTVRQYGNLTTRPFSPMRDVVEKVESIEAEIDRPVIFACYGHGKEMMPIYAPQVRGAVTLTELEALIAEARSKQAELLVTYGHPAFNRVIVADGFELLDDESQFAEVESWKGIEPDAGYVLLEWRGETATE